jgi:predicted outer membrane repeat protein
MSPKSWLLGLALVFGASSTLQAQAATEVTVCGRDDAAGGVNLIQALAGGGEIVVRCGAGPQTIEITRTHSITRETSLDGEGRVALTGVGTAHFFALTATLKLANLTVRNTNANGDKTSIATGESATIELRKVRTENTIRPYVVDSLVAEDSIFEGNGDAAGYSYGSVIHAQNITLLRATLVRNHDHPIAGGAWRTVSPAAAARRISILDSEFAENRMTSLISNARLVVQGGSFRDNGRSFVESGGTWDCCGGALTITQSVGEISNSSFIGNKSYGFGGAIYATGSRLTLSRTRFEGNSARIGGAVMHVGRPLKNNIWSLTPFGVAPRLTLLGAQFRNNSAQYDGGAIAWAGAIDGDAPLFVKNSAGGAGGALVNWRAIIDLPPDFAGVLPAVQAMTDEAGELLAFSRPLIADNVAAAVGGIEAGPAAVRLGNAILARNAVTGSSPRNYGLNAAGPVQLVNTTIADHSGGGLALEGAATLVLINTILADNAGGACVGADGKINLSTASIQHPGATCGTAIQSINPALGGGFTPSLWSPARDKADAAGCVTDLVQAIDIYGSKRLAKGQCSIGAVEADLERDIRRALPSPQAKNFHLGWWLWIFLFILILASLIGLLIGFLRRRKKPANGKDSCVVRREVV